MPCSSGSVPSPSPRSKTFSPDPAVTHGERLESVGRRGKLLLLRFPSATHVVHLMQGGRHHPDPKQAAKPKGGQARWVFDDGRALLLSEQGTERKAGVWSWTATLTTRAPRPPRPRGDRRRRRRPARATPRGEHAGCTGSSATSAASPGIGRRLANEVLPPSEAVPVHHDRQARARRRRRPRRSDRRCGRGGSPPTSGPGTTYVVVEGPARDRSTTAPARPAPCAATPSAAVAYTRYTVHYCPTCQTGGKVLADNTTSQVPQVRLPATTCTQEARPSAMRPWPLTVSISSTSSCGGGVDAGPAEVVDVEALDDARTRRRCVVHGKLEMMPSGTP